MLAALFFLLSLGMAWYLGHAGGASSRPADDLGVMSGVDTPAAPKAPGPAGSAAPITVPAAAANSDVPAAPAIAAPTTASPATSDVPPAPTAAAPAAAPAPATPTPATKPADKKKH
jgi:preprotein translocase subunit SecG